MTQPASTICCAGCGYVADPADPCPFRCPRAGTDDTDHVLTRVLRPGQTRFRATPPVNPTGPTAPVNPFLRYRTLMHSYHVATARGLSDAGYCDLVASLDASVAAVGGHGFRATPFARSRELSEALAFSADGGVWVKDETGNVSGSHKGRHLMGVLIHLAVMERCGLLDPARRRELAVASCGNAALAAAMVARAGGWRADRVRPARTPTHGSSGSACANLGARVVVCPREPGALGDPAYLRLRRELDRGRALPFTTQGPENGLAIEGGQTLGYELVTDLDGAGLDHLIVQVGGGALASACVQALREAADLGAMTRLPRVHTVQTAGAHPLERAYRRVRAKLPGDPTPSAIHQAMADAARHRSAFMAPWPGEPKSVATGILDDETYDWRAVVEGMLLTGGRPLVVAEDTLAGAHRLAVARTGIPVDPTGSSGLAGLVDMRRSGEIGDHDRVAVLFTGLRRT